MNPTVKKQWLEALRSGKYQQGNGRLRSSRDGVDRFCCLGVLCDLLEPESWTETSVPGFYRHSIHEGYPGSTVLESAGLEHDQCQILASMNDNGKSFEDVAQFIEVTL
jgi:hypothetical protein